PAPGPRCVAARLPPLATKPARSTAPIAVGAANSGRRSVRQPSLVISRPRTARGNNSRKTFQARLTRCKRAVHARPFNEELSQDRLFKAAFGGADRHRG